jgi:putative transposase
VIWRNEFETIDQARAAIGAYVDHYHDRPHSGLDYRTPKEVRQTWEDAQEEFDGLQKQAA